MRQVGRKGKLWLKTRREWVKLNSPNFQGYYTCHICGRWVHEKDLTLDHVVARSKRPDLVNDLDNLKPAHYVCNSVKGSS